MDAGVGQMTLTDVALQMIAGERVGEFSNEYFQEVMDALLTSGDNSVVGHLAFR